MREYFAKTYQHGLHEYVTGLKKSLQNNEKRFIVTANPETFMIGIKNNKFKKILENPKTEIVPDGIGVVKAARLLGYPIEGRVTGVELSQKLLDMGDELGKSIYLFGAKRDVLELLVRKINSTYHHINIVGWKDGYVDNKEEVFDEIADKNPDIILVALGIPQQEILIDQNYHRLKKGIMIGVGGSFDVLSGMKKRAPDFFVKCNLEWMYRILKEPKRIRRFLVSNVKFIFEIIKLKKGGKNNAN